MDAMNFAYWLNGFAELHGNTPPTKEQWKSIREHLELVFTKVTPPVSEPGIKIPTTPNLQVIPATYETPWWLRQAQCATGVSDQKAQSYC